MINRPLLNPVQSKREYFWLFLIVVLENLITLGMEVGNGAVWSNQVGWLRHYNEISDRVMTGTLLQLGRQTGHPLPGGGVPVAVLQEISPHQGRHRHSQVWGLDQLPSSLSLLCYRHAHEGSGE